MQQLSCTGLADIDLLRHLKLARKVVQKSLSLREVSLAFPHDLLDGLLDMRRQSQLVALCNLMHTMASKIVGPVIVLSQGLLFRCTSADILRWQLHDIHGDASSSKFLRRPVRIPAHAVVRNQSEEPIEIKLIPSICSISMRCFWFQSCTLIVVNPESAHSLHLGTVGAPLAQHSIPGPNLTDILPLITLPDLRQLHLNTTTVSPAALADFLLRHPSVVVLAYEPPQTEIRPPLILTPPSAHPALARVFLNDPIHVIAVLDSLDASPALVEIGFRYLRSDFPASPSAVALTAALRRIALQPRPTTLALTLAPGSSRRALDATEIKIAENLHSVVRIVVGCNSVSDARALLPWLNKLPALERVEFRTARGIWRLGTGRRDAHPDALRFLDDALARLPGVKEVLVREVPMAG
ncbi:hypothetical protein K438DRAFT_1840187 [Mycena galopus ATCC 62051]|nr:hypothetical protein K438DRAFT_1840187 [Mycena galopus ATCC 62051]